MFVTKEMYLGMQHRIEELENILCPCGAHDWVEVEDYNGYDIWKGEMRTGKRYQCRKCLKKKYIEF